MPRLARLPLIPFGWYYVALRSVPNRRIVTSPTDLSTALKLLRATLRENGARLHAGYLAEREVHLALQVGEVPLSAITGGFQHEYARLFNRIHNEHRSLFRLHHHVLLIQQERWLVPLVALFILFAVSNLWRVIQAARGGAPTRRIEVK